MPRIPRLALPPELRDGPFTVARGHALGVGQSRMRGPDLDRPFHGIRMIAAPVTPAQGADIGALHLLDLPDLRRRSAALLAATPAGAHLSHITAARIWPLPLPSIVGTEPVHVSVRPPGRPPRRPGVSGHEVTDPHASVVLRDGLHLVDPATLFCQLSTALRLPDLVAVGDALTLRPVYVDVWPERPWVPLSLLAERVDAFRGRGKKAAARALALVRPGAESRPETLVRLELVAAGLPEPAVNVEIYTADGHFLGRGDLVYEEWKLIVEYDGDQHRTSTLQFDKDVVRLDDFTAHGWRVVRILGRSFFLDRAAAIGRVRRALIDRGWTP